MKISKLFHYLYATIMVLPLIFIAPVVGYYTFNKNADTQIVVNYPDLEVNVNQHAKPLNEWDTTDANVVISSDTATITSNTKYGRFRQEIIGISGNNYLMHFKVKLSTPNSNIIAFIGQLSYIGQEGVYKYLDAISNTEWNEIYIIGNYDKIGTTTAITFIDFRDSDWDSYQIKDVSVIDLTQALGSNLADYIYDLEVASVGAGVDYFNTYFADYPMEYNNGTSMIFKDYANPYTNYQSSVESMNNALNETFDLPLFAWSKNSFVKAPFDSITSLFGLSPTNVVTYLLTYWATISIIWLCFDLLMYLPNLIHRWIDRSSY